MKRRKDNDIINALIKEGNDDDRTIPIETEQTQDWYKDATEKELKELEDKDITQHEDDPDVQGGKIADNDVEVFYEDDEWKVQTKGAKRPSNTYDTKERSEEHTSELQSRFEIVC